MATRISRVRPHGHVKIKLKVGTIFNLIPNMRAMSEVGVIDIYIHRIRPRRI